MTCPTERIYEDHPQAVLYYAHFQRRSAEKARLALEQAKRRGDTRGQKHCAKVLKSHVHAALVLEGRCG